ncbi:methionine synthase [Dermacoccus profundi]
MTMRATQVSARETVGPRASGVGSLPEMGARDAVRAVRDLLVGDVPDGTGIPYVPEQSTRGPGADMIGRGADLLVEMSADLQPSGWRLTPPGSSRSRDLRRAGGYLGEDLDEVAEAYDGYTGPLKTQVVGPWTLAASLWLPRGDRVLSDHGATRDLGQSLAAGLAAHLEHVRTLVPGASPIAQLDEPSLPAVLSGGLKTLSGVGRLRRIDEGEARDVLGHVVDTVKAAGAQVVVHSCAPHVPVSLLHRLGVDGVSLDTSLLTEAAFEPLGEAIDSGLTLWAGLVPTSTAERHPRAHVEAFERMWRRIGFGAGEYDRIVVTPACGLAGLAPNQAVTVQRLAVEAVQMLADTSD